MRLGDYVMDYRSAEALFRTPTQRTWFGLFLVSFFCCLSSPANI